MDKNIVNEKSSIYPSTYLNELFDLFFFNSFGYCPKYQVNLEKCIDNI